MDSNASRDSSDEDTGQSSTRRAHSVKYMRVLLAEMSDEQKMHLASAPEYQAVAAEAKPEDRARIRKILDDKDEEEGQPSTKKRRCAFWNLAAYKVFAYTGIVTMYGNLGDYRPEGGAYCGLSAWPGTRSVAYSV